MAFGLSITIFLLLLTGTVTVKGSDLSDALDDNDSHHAPAVDRAKRWSGFHLFDGLRGSDHFGFNLEDALHPGSQVKNPAVKPTGKPEAGDCQESVLQKLGTIIDNQNQQLRLLLQIMAQPPASSRFNEKAMR